MNMERPLLIDSNLDIKLKENGFVVFPLFNDEAIQSLLTYYLSKNTAPTTGMSASAHSPDIEFRKEVNRTINAVLNKFTSSHFQNLTLLGSSFITKNKGENGSLAPHQDWNLTDEKMYRSFNLWVPLVDTNSQNGGIMVLPGSHKITPNFRGPGIPSIVEPIIDEVWKQMIAVEIPAGSALLYDHRLIHASKENRTEKERIVAVTGLLESDAPMYIYYGEEHNISIYSITPDYFLEQNPNDGPKNIVLVESFEYDLSSPSVTQSIKSFQDAGIQINIKVSKKKFSLMKWIQQLLT